MNSKAIVVVVFAVFVAAAIERATAQNTTSAGNSTCVFLDGPPDVNLTIPKLKVGRIELVVEDLFAHLNLNAKASELVDLSAGVDASITKVNLTIANVSAEVALVVRLDNVRCMVNRVIDTLDRHPEILTDTVGVVGDTLQTLIGAVAQLPNVLSAVLGNSTSTVLVTLLDEVGAILQQIIGTSGTVLSTNQIGTLPTLNNVAIVRNFNQGGKNMVRYLYSAANAVIDCVKEGGNALSGCKIISKPV